MKKSTAEEKDHDHWFTTRAEDFVCPLCGEEFDLPIEPVFIEVETEKNEGAR